MTDRQIVVLVMGNRFYRLRTEPYKPKQPHLNNNEVAHHRGTLCAAFNPMTDSTKPFICTA